MKESQVGKLMRLRETDQLEAKIRDGLPEHITAWNNRIRHPDSASGLADGFRR